eukprot:8545113-Pyramimonas_sp.AAC.1
MFRWSAWEQCRVRTSTEASPRTESKNTPGKLRGVRARGSCQTKLSTGCMEDPALPLQSCASTDRKA